MASLNWMAWTGVTAGFFLAIAMMLIALTVLENYYPTVARRGFLPLVTTRGDRVFICLLLTAWVHIGVVGLTDWPVWWASVACLVGAPAVLRWG